MRVSAFLYAASRENDNDFHLIIGRNPKSSPMYMTSTWKFSGLPPKNANFFARIKRARDAYKNSFFGAKLLGPSYHFYRPPIPVEIEGSLFFDITHAKGGHPGPKRPAPSHSDHLGGPSGFPHRVRTLRGCGDGRAPAAKRAKFLRIANERPPNHFAPIPEIPNKACQSSPRRYSSLPKRRLSSPRPTKPDPYDDPKQNMRKRREG